MKRLWAACAVTASSLLGCSRSSPAPTAGKSAIVYVLATPTPVPEVKDFTPIPTAGPAASAANETFHSSEQTVSFRPTAPQLPATVAAIPSLDREREPAPTTLRDQMVRCLTYTVRVEDYGPLGTRNLVRAHVHARNSCQDAAFSGGDCWFEIRSKDKFGNTLSREVGRFQDAIPVRGEADTVIEITSGFGESVEASPWWAAGGGRKAGQ